MSNHRSNDLIRNLMLNNYIEAQSAFEDIMIEKASDALDAISVGITDAMFNDDICEECDEDIEESKMADKDYDGDGKVETGTAEWKGSRDKAIKKNMATRKEEVEELDELKMPAKNKYGEYKSGKVRKAALAGSRRASKQSDDELRGAMKDTPTGDFGKSRRAGKRASQRLARIVNVKGREDAANIKKQAEAEKGRQKVGAGKRKRFSIVSSYEPEGESIDELKSDTLRSYVQKAGRDNADRPFSNKEAKRRAGIAAALSRLDARKQMGAAPPGSQRGAEYAKLARVHPKDKSAYDLKGNK